MSSHRGVRSLAARARIARRWALHVLVLAALLVGVFRAGALYFYCPMMGELHDAPCCEAGDDASEGPGVAETECCKPGAIGHLPASAAPSPIELPSQSSTLAVLSTFTPRAHHVHARGRTTVDVPRRRPPRSRAGPPIASVRRAKLGVYLI